MICDLDDTMKAGEAKIALMELYPEDWQVAIVKADAEQMSHVWCALYEMDRHSFDATSCVVVPPLSFEKRTRYVYADLQRIVNILRAPDGCPWDAEQTHFSLKSQCWKMRGDCRRGRRGHGASLRRIGRCNAANGHACGDCTGADGIYRH
ncbi:MAG: hypothetical protein ACLT0Y_08115 [Christensenellales bacterium]